MAGDERGRIRLKDLLRVDIPKLHAAITSEGLDATPAVRFALRLVREERNKHKLRVLYCPPLPLLWGFRSADGSAATRIHQAYARELWRERGFAGRLRVLLKYLAWPLIVGGALAWFTALNGRAVRRRSGRSILRQLWDQARLAVRHAILPPWYYMFELADDERLARAGQYLRRDETKGGLYRLLGKRSAKRILQRKIVFADHCHAHGIRTPDYLHARRGRVRGAERRKTPALPRADLFAKPSRGRGGRSTETWRYDGSGWSRGADAPLDEAALVAHFAELSQTEVYLIQRRVVPHPDLADLSGDILTTVRMLTILDEDGRCVATHAAFRMPNGPRAKVDNFHAGGIAAKVDLGTGELGPASDMGLRPDSIWHTTHPDSGAPISGRKIPYWEATLDLARRAHESLRDWTVIGWDIAITDDGPLVIEGNCSPDLDIIQRSHREPIGDSRFGELFAHHLAQRERRVRAGGGPDGLTPGPAR